MKRFFAKMLLISSMALSFTACKKDDPVHEHENEFINGIRMEFVNGEEKKVFEWIEKGNIDSIVLTPGTKYQVYVSFLDIDHEEDITEEIKEDGHNHQVFITTTPSDLLQVAYTDQDKNGLPVGIESDITTTSAGTGTLRLQLKHYAGNKDGNAASGSTDVSVDFSLVVQ